MKKSIIISILLILSFQLFALPISRKLAQKAAQNWMQSNKQNFICEISNGFTIKNNETNLFYIFNFKKNGYVIVSADNNIQPILAYSYSAYANKETDNPGASLYLEYYKQSIDQILDNQIISKQNQALWHSILHNYYTPKTNSKDVTPLISTTWAQGYPYNLDCPSDGGQTTLVGCVAVAMGQIMKYYDYPEHGSGSNSYQWNGQTISADFENTYYDWENMPNYLGYSSSYIEKQAVAELLFHAGVASNMNYGVDGSGTSSNYAEYGLKYYFDYALSLELKEKNSFSPDDWEALLREDLEDGIPIYYAGDDGTFGHAFVCDGYQNESYFHFNWGWEGSYDGYFYLNDLTPGYGYSFNLHQQAIFGIEPPEVAIPPANLFAQVFNTDVLLSWDAPETTKDLLGYNIYRNEELIYEFEGTEATSYYDVSLEAGDYEYYVTAVYTASESPASNVVEVSIGSFTEETICESDINLMNYPNPFNPETTIKFNISKNEIGHLTIYNTKGQLLEKHQFNSGQHNYIWDAQNYNSGVYFYKLRAGSSSTIRKMILMK